MTIKLLVVSTATNTNRILDAMKTQAGDELEVVLHFGDKSADYMASSLSRMKSTTGTKGHLMDGRPYAGAASALIKSQGFHEGRGLFLEHMERMSESFRYKSHPLNSQHERHDYYQIVIDAIAQEVQRTGASHCLLFNLPQMAYDTAVYQVARSLGLPITMVTESLFPDRFFSLADPVDNGAFKVDPGSESYAMEKGKRPDLFYMKGVKQEREKGGRISAAAIVQLATFLFLKRPLQALNPFYLWKTLSRMQAIYGSLPKWRDPFARFFHEDELAYFEHLTSFEDQSVDLTGDYVFFPLQLQPEVTTAALGGKFRDQAYAIECLSKMLPDGVRLLVKENPRQGAYMRGPLFFHRLKRIANVTFLPSWADTHALTDGAKFVAAITGTVGWEAIRAGKPALVFGNAWYRKLPGVYEYSDGPTYDQIVSTPIDHAELEKAVGSLLSRSHAGVVDRNFTRIVDGFDEAKNSTKVAETLLALLRGEVDHTFG